MKQYLHSASELTLDRLTDEGTYTAGRNFGQPLAELSLIKESIFIKVKGLFCFWDLGIWLPGFS